MLDINTLRADVQAVAARLADRGYTLEVAQFAALEAERDLAARYERLLTAVAPLLPALPGGGARPRSGRPPWRVPASRP